MSSWRIEALPTAIAAEARITLKSPKYGHPAHTEMARGYGPCRHCLETFRVDEERRVLFTYDSFHEREPLPLPGPIFIHERECARYAADDTIPPMLLGLPMTLNAYAHGRRIVAQEHVPGTDAAVALDRLFARDDVAYVQVRNTEAGCFMFHVSRRPAW